MAKKKVYHFPLALKFDQYVEDLKLKNNRSKGDIVSRVDHILESGYTNQSTGKRFIFYDQDIKDCIDAIPRVLDSVKEYKSIALQTLAAVFLNINDAVNKNNNITTLKSFRSNFVHYYKFIERELSNAHWKRTTCLSEQEAQDLQAKLNRFFNHNSDVTCFTQKEVRDIFVQRLHSQNRLYNPKLLFPITLIVKLLNSTFLASEWTNEAIDEIDILIDKKKKTIKFKDVSFFLMSTSGIFVFDRQGDPNAVYTRKYIIIEEDDAIPMSIKSIEQPLQTFAIDHTTSMMNLIEKQTKRLSDVIELKRLSDGFIDFVTNQGKNHIKKSWLKDHPRAEGIALLTSKTINDLANGYKHYLELNNKLLTNEQKNRLIKDLKVLHKRGRLELMDSFENGKKGGDL